MKQRRRGQSRPTERKDEGDQHAPWRVFSVTSKQDNRIGIKLPGHLLTMRLRVRLMTTCMLYLGKYTSRTLSETLYVILAEGYFKDIIRYIICCTWGSILQGHYQRHYMLQLSRKLPLLSFREGKSRQI